ncbi:hypothetical protein T439DRAFT_352189 [Meredithblackwellia eburnea MCA 4105]
MFKLSSISLTPETINAQLYQEETLIQAQDNEKDLQHDDGRLHLTTHRLLYMDSARPLHASLSLDLSQVRQTEYWTGFMKSHPKITLLLGEAGAPVLPVTKDQVQQPPKVLDDIPAVGAARSWICRVCGMSNSSGTKCSLCGVAKDPTGPPSAISRSATPALRDRERERERTSSSSSPLIRSATPTTIPSSSSVPSTSSGNTIVSTSATTTVSSTTTDNRIPCPVCTFLNHPSMATCELCDSPLTTFNLPSSVSSLSISSSQTNSPLTSRPPTRTNTPGPGESTPGTPPPGESSSPSSAPFVRLSFRKGGEKAFYAALKTALAGKAWEQKRAVPKPDLERSGVGIDAIMRGLDSEARTREGEMDDAFKDLNALMAKAKEMILLAQQMNERLSTQPTSASTGETTMVRSSLVDLGLPAEAVTPDMARDEREYHKSLAGELGTILGRKDGVMKDGIVGLDEVWCVWNRARGVSLVAPKDLKLAAPYLAQQSPRIYLRTFRRSGLTILHTSRYTRSAFAARLLDILDLRRALAESYHLSAFEGAAGETLSAVEREGITTLELAKEEGVALNLAKEMVEELEQASGDVVRDEQGGEGIRWYRNYIVGESLAAKKAAVTAASQG